MSDRLPDRLARRRQAMKQKQARRRQLVAGAGLAAVVLVAIFLVTRGGEDEPSGSGSVTKAANTGNDRPETNVKAKPAGAQPDSSWKPSKAPVPILMYHVIGEPAGDVAYPDLYLSVDRFKEQVNWLKENSYTPVTLIQVQNAWYDDGALPPKPVVLSFDDGYLGQYLDAMPILAEKGWAGQLNLKAEGSDLSSKQVKKMIAAGWEIASHTISHPDLTTLDPAALDAELRDSKRILEKDLGIEIINFCYPAGKYDAAVAEAVEAAGYRGATTVDPGLADRNEPFTLKRIRIDSDFGAAELAGALEI